MYNETNYTALFTDPVIPFNTTGEMSLALVNGTGSMKLGYMSSYCRVEGFDLLLQLLIVITVFLAFLLVLVGAYVALYIWRYMNHD